MNEPQKKQSIADAVKSLFNEDVSLTIKLASASEKTEKTTQNKSEVKPEENQKKNKIREIEKETDQEEETSEDLALEKANNNSKDAVKRMESDQEKMILSLFDGKYVS